MEVLRYEDPAAFRHDGEPVLAAEPARNQLFLGLLQTLMDDPHVYPSFHLWLATDGDLLPGVVANRPWADRSAAVVGRRTGRGVARVLREGVWELTEVADVPVPPGAPRAATPLDRDLIMAWQGAFAAESLPADFPWDEAEAERLVDLRLARTGGGFWLWERDGPVSLSGFRLLPGSALVLHRPRQPDLERDLRTDRLRQALRGRRSPVRRRSLRRRVRAVVNPRTSRADVLV